MGDRSIDKGIGINEGSPDPANEFHDSLALLHNQYEASLKHGGDRFHNLNEIVANLRRFCFYLKENTTSINQFIDDPNMHRHIEDIGNTLVSIQMKFDTQQINFCNFCCPPQIDFSPEAIKLTECILEFTITLNALILQIKEKINEYIRRFLEADNLFNGDYGLPNYPKSYLEFDSLYKDILRDSKLSRLLSNYIGDCLYKLAYMNEKGLGRYSDLVVARQIYVESAKSYSNSKAMNALGRLSEVKYNQLNEYNSFLEAKDFYLQASELGNIDGTANYAHLMYQYYLKLRGNCGQNRNGVDSNNEDEKYYQEAIDKYSKASEYSHPLALNNYGLILIRVNSKDSVISGVMHLLRSGQMNNPVALNNLGIIYESGKFYHDKDYAKAEQYYKMSSDLGHLPGKCNYGYFLLKKGLSLPYEEGKDMIYEAHKLFVISTQAENSEALYYLGLINQYGYSGEVNEKNMIKYYLHSHQLHHIKASYQLGLILIESYRFVQGYKLVSKCSELGYGPAKEYIKRNKEIDLNLVYNKDAESQLDIDNIGIYPYYCDQLSFFGRDDLKSSKTTNKRFNQSVPIHILCERNNVFFPDIQ